jgi:hypothetical protein
MQVAEKLDWKGLKSVLFVFKKLKVHLKCMLVTGIIAEVFRSQSSWI